MIKEIKDNIINIIKDCDAVQLSTFSENNFPETRFIANMLNKNIKDNELILYFVTNKNSHKAQQIQNNNKVCLYYFNQKNRHAMTLFSEVEIILDQKEKEKFWMDDWKNYGYTGKEDENYCILKIQPKIYKYYLDGFKEQRGEIN